MTKKHIAKKVLTDKTMTKSSGNVFADLGFSNEESVVLLMRAELIAKIRETINSSGWTQIEAASHLGIGQSRVSDLVRGKRHQFSLDMLVTLATRVGREVQVNVLQ